MNNPVLWQAGIGVLTLFFFYLMYMFTKTWRWFHVTMMFFVYCTSIATVVYVSMTIKTHDAWRKMVHEQRKLVVELSAERDKLTFGDITKRKQDTTPIRELHARLGRSILDRGRVWRACTITSGPAADGTVTINTAGATVAPGARNNISEEMILYAFTEAPAPAELAPVLENPASAIGFPQYFIGEFTATMVAETSVTLRPTFQLTAVGRAVMATGAPWCLYETMAPDGHSFFVRDQEKVIDLTLDADTEPVFGAVEERHIALHMAHAGKLQAETDEQFLQRYQSIILEYVRDGKRASDEDPPENRWLKVLFTVPYKESAELNELFRVDSTSKLGAVVTSEDFFDQGRAEIAILQRNETAKFKKNDIGVFPSDDANQLIGLGVCELVEPIYVRSLRNYAQTYRELYQRSRDLAADVTRIRRSTAELTHANGLTVSQIAYREQEQTQIDEDLEKFIYEHDQIKIYSETLTAAVTAKRNKLSYLYRANHKLATDLAAAHRALTEEIDRQTAAAANSP